ncbi:MAG TPA: enoyl-CoA hydratase-related protein [Solirubrobacterales bacterium]|nr:enoyl-CoA hydratase-related protein [Solirubrobacterales bacterium]
MQSPERIGDFLIEVDEGGIATVTFDRPPVNSVSIEVYEALPELRRRLEHDAAVRVVILAAPDGARAWCGGADLNDFVGMDPPKRKQRYARINQLLPHLRELERPTIAAINAHTVGIGVVLAALCDLRVAADSASFACKEIEYGLVPGEGGLLASLRMPQGLVREMLLTARRFSAEEMRHGGYLNAVVPRAEVMAKARELAALMAAKSLPALRATKRTQVAIEGMEWDAAYLLAQEASAELTGGEDAAEGVAAFLEGRPPRLVDR